MKRLLFVIITVIILVSCDSVSNQKTTTEINYRQSMRKFVQGISEYAKEINPNFIIIPQNGHELITENGEETGAPVMNYLNAIDGIGREDLFYGYDADDKATSESERNYMEAFMHIAESNGVEVLVTDYCSTQSYMDDSYNQNEERSYISFAADHRELDNIPEYPATPLNVNDSDITLLSEAKNFLYLLNTDSYNSKEAFLSAIQNTDYDGFVIDLFYLGEYELNASDIASLKVKSNGGTRLVIAYMSIGEAEDYRYYWEEEWAKKSPSWLAEENPYWPGNYKVRYWDETWQSLIYGNDDSYLKKIIDAGFDGVYLDIIDAFEYFEGQLSSHDEQSSEATTQEDKMTFITGADLSYVNEIEANGGIWRDTSGNIVDPYAYFAERNAQLLRLRLFHTPENIIDDCGNPISANNLPYVLNAAQRIVNTGADLMITLHYGDYFKYPADQQMPAAWQGLSHEELLNSIYAYTYEVLEELHQQSTVPYIISIGNESTWGFIDDTETTDGWEWPQDADKFNVAFNAVDDFNADYAQSVKKTLHLIDESVEANIEDFENNGVTNYDIIGYSFYPGFSLDVTIEEIGQQVKRLVNRYPDKQVIILETGWHWTDDEADDYENFLDWSNVIDYPRSEQGQLDYMMDLKETVKKNGASGLLYWEPTWITSDLCDKWGQGSSYEDVTFFDFNNNNKALKAFEFFGSEE